MSTGSLDSRRDHGRTPLEILGDALRVHHVLRDVALGILDLQFDIAACRKQRIDLVLREIGYRGVVDRGDLVSIREPGSRRAALESIEVMRPFGTLLKTSTACAWRGKFTSPL